MSTEFLLSNNSELQKKLYDFQKILKSNGLQKLTIVCDFDQTLSSDSSLITHQSFPENVFIKSTREFLFVEQQNMNNKFAEKQKTLSTDEMPELYSEWWNESHRLIINSNFHKNQLRECAERITLRNGAEEFLNFCKLHNLRLIIFTAGISNIVRECLTLTLGCSNPQNVFVLGNEMKFQFDGSVHSFSSTIHSMNKTYECFADELDGHIGNPSACLVIGDSQYDANMMKGYKRPILKIGLGEGKDFFDAVLEKDSFAPLTSWLNELKDCC